MRGHILGFDGATGAINGDDGSRYSFTASEWKGGTAARGGETVDFVGTAGVATEVFPVAAGASTGGFGAAGSAGFAAASAAPVGTPSNGSLVARAKNMLLAPAVEWHAIAAAPMTPKQIMTYAAILSGIGYAIAAATGLIWGLIGLLAWHASFVGLFTALILPIGLWALGLVILYVMGMIASALAPNFKGVKDNTQGLKLVAFAGTAFWVANFFYFIPVLGTLIAIAGACYGIYLLYLGSRPVMKVPEDSAIVYTLLTVVIWAVMNGIVYGVLTAIFTAIILSTAVVTTASTTHFYTN